MAPAPFASVLVAAAVLGAPQHAVLHPAAEVHAGAAHAAADLARKPVREGLAHAGRGGERRAALLQALLALPLQAVEIGQAHQRLVGALDDHPFAGVVLRVGLLHVELLRPAAHDQRALVHGVGEHPVHVARAPPPGVAARRLHAGAGVLHPAGGRGPRVVEVIGDLRVAEPSRAHAEHFAHVAGHLRVGHQVVRVLGVAHVPVGDAAQDHRPASARGGERAVDLAAQVAAVQVVEKRPQVQRHALQARVVLAVQALAHQHETGAHRGERLLDELLALDVVAAQAAGVLRGHAADAARAQVVHHALEGLAVLVGAGVALVGVHLGHNRVGHLGEVLLHDAALVVDGGSVVVQELAGAGVHAEAAGLGLRRLGRPLRGGVRPPALTRHGPPLPPARPRPWRPSSRRGPSG